MNFLLSLYIYFFCINQILCLESLGSITAYSLTSDTVHNTIPNSFTLTVESTIAANQKTYLATFISSKTESNPLTYNCKFTANDSLYCELNSATIYNGNYILTSIEDADNNFTITELSIKIKLGNFDQVESVNFIDGYDCPSQPTDIKISFYIEIDFVPSSVTFTKSDDSSLIVQCSNIIKSDDSLSITCTPDFIIITTYTLSAIDSIVNFSAAKKTSVTYLGSPIKPEDQVIKFISSSTEEFSFELNDALNYQSFYYYTRFGYKELTCNIDNVTVTCTTGSIDIDFSKVNNVVIDYRKVGCGVTKSLNTGLTLETGPSHSITITEFQFDDETLCHTSQYPNIRFKTDYPMGTLYNVSVFNKDTSKVVALVTKDCYRSDTTISCSYIKTLEKGKYKINEIIGVNTYTFSEDFEIIVRDYDVYHGLRYPIQHISSIYNTIGIVVWTETENSLPKMYLNSNELSCIREVNYANCTVEETSIVKGQEYQLYYSDVCTDSNSEAGIAITLVDYKDVVIESLSFQDGTVVCFDKCLPMIFTTNVQPNKILRLEFSSNSSTMLSFTCTTDGTTVTCPKYANFVDGEYTLTEIKGPDNYDISKVSSTVIYYCKYWIDILVDSQSLVDMHVTRINDSIEFSVTLLFDPGRNLQYYLGKDTSKEISCQRIGETMEVHCQVDKSYLDFTKSTIYYVYYDHFYCKFIMPTGIRITTDIIVIVNSFSLPDDDSITEIGIEAFKLTTDMSPGNVNSITVHPESKADDSEDLTISCNAVDSVITCTPDTKLEFDSYSLVSVSGEFTYRIEETFTVKYVTPKISRTPEAIYQEVSTNIASFSFSLMSSITPTPTFYLGKDENKPLICDIVETEVTCTVGDEDKGVEGQHRIYYSSDDGLVYTGIEISTGAPREVAVESITTKEGTQCTMEEDAINTLEIKTVRYPSKVTSIVLESNNETFTYTSCSFTLDNNIKCSNQNPTAVSFNSYSIKEITGVNQFMNLEQFTISYSQELQLGEQQSPQYVSTNMPTLTVVLKETETRTPNIYIDQDDDLQLDCTEDNHVYTCKLNDTVVNFSEKSQHNLYYKSDCGTFLTIGIAFEVYAMKTLSVTKLAIKDSAMECQSEPFAQVNFITSDNVIAISSIELESEGEKIASASCTSTDNKCSCSFESEFSVGTYSLTAIKGFFNYDLSQVNAITYEAASVKTSQSNTTQTVKRTSPIFTVDLIDSASIPEIYAGNDITKQISCQKKSQALLECTPNITVMPDAKEYEIFYRKPCEDTLSPIGIKVNNILSLTLTVSDIAVKDSGECSTRDVTHIVLTVNEEPTGGIEYLLLRKGGNDYKFETCVAESTTITCSSGITLTEEGEYTVVEVIGDDTYETEALTKKIIIDKSIEPIDSATQIERQKINKKTNTFTVKVVQDAKKPSIFIDEEGKKEVSCDDVVDNNMLCHVNSTVLPETKDYIVYYKGVCDKISTTGITLENAIAVDVAVTSIVIVNSENEICSRVPITEIKLTTNSTEPKEVENVVLSKEKSDFSVTYKNCVTQSDYITCKSEVDTQIETGAYTVKEVNGTENNFIITDVQSQSISYFVDYISISTEVTYQINNVKTSFELELTQQTSDVALYVETKDKQLPCTKKDDLLYECTPNDTLMPISKTYELLYVPSCRDSLETTNIKVEYSVTIKTTGFSLADSKVCSKEEIASIVITTDKKPTQDIESAVIAHTDGSQYTFNTCTYSETTITCTDLASALKRGEYKLHSVNGKDSFVTSELESTVKYDPEMISTETKLDPTVDRDNEKFTITLTDNNLEPIKFFIGNAQDIELSCEQNGAEVVCTTNDEIMATNDDYEIYYIGSCGQFENTNILVKREKVFSVTNITLPDDQLCIVEPIASIIITLDAKPTSAITSATITDSVNEYKFTTCVDDEETHTIITCSSPDKNILAAKYTLLSMEGPDSYNVSLVQDTIVKYEVDPLGTQSISQTIDNDTKTFTVELASEDTDQPVIYMNEDEPMEFNCTKESTTLTCDYNETYMPENGEYEILYEGACRIPGTTNIKVTRLLPVTVTSVSIGAEEAICTGEGINQITITTDIKPFTDVNSIIITDESTDYTIENCTVNDTTVTCNTPVSQIEYGVYKIKEVDAGEVYDVKINSISGIELKYEQDPLGELQMENNTNLIIDNETLSFTIKGENIIEVPHIYAGNDLTREILCEFAENENTIITCTPDDVNMNENKFYEIYYEGPCGELKNTGITVEKTNAPIIDDPNAPEGNNPEIVVVTKGNYLFMRKLLFCVLVIFIL